MNSCGLPNASRGFFKRTLLLLLQTPLLLLQTDFLFIQKCGCERTDQASFRGVAGAEVSQAGRVDHQLAGEGGEEMKMIGRKEGGNSRVVSNLPQGGSGLKGCVGGVFE